MTISLSSSKESKWGFNMFQMCASSSAVLLRIEYENHIGIAKKDMKMIELLKFT